MVVVLLAGGALLLHGCATLSKGECLAADWWLIGQKDGTKGLSLDVLEEHREACAEYGVTPDRDAYAEGRQSGLMVYCTRFNGYAIGRGGSSYPGVCSGPLAEQFELGLRRGRLVRALEMDVWDIKRERRKLRKEIDRLEHEQKTLREKLEADESVPQDRESMQERIEEIDQELEERRLEYEDSSQRQESAIARLDEATEQAREDGYADDGGLLGTYRDFKDMFD